MIAKGNPHGDGARLASYLVKGRRGELAELAVLRGFAAGDPAAAFRQEQFRARGTKAAAGFFHCYVRLAPGERLTRQQWIEVVAARAERTLGFTGQPCAMSFHIDRATGARHLHLAWSRIACRADGRLYALDPGLYKLKLKELSRALEQQLGLKIVSSERQPGDRARAAGRGEFEESRRLDTDLKTIRTTILDCFETSDSGRAFNAALAAAGLMLAQGDKRDCFVVIDAAGGHHALNKKLTGLTFAQIRQRLGGPDLAQLPGVDQAQTRQRARLAEGAADPAREFSRAASRAAEPAPEAVETRKHGRAARMYPNRRHLRSRRRSAPRRRRLTGGAGRSCSGISPARSPFASGAWCRCRTDRRQSRRSSRAARRPDGAEIPRATERRPGPGTRQ